MHPPWSVRRQSGGGGLGKHGHASTAPAWNGATVGLIMVDTVGLVLVRTMEPPRVPRKGHQRLQQVNSTTGRLEYLIELHL